MATAVGGAAAAARSRASAASLARSDFDPVRRRGVFAWSVGRRCRRVATETRARARIRRGEQAQYDTLATVRWTIAAIACLALAGAAVFAVTSEKQLTARRADVRAYALRARDAAGALSDLRAAQQAYVAAGQGIAYWMPKVTATSALASAAIAELRTTATSAAAKSAADQASQTLADFAEIDARAREYLKSNQELMAADVVFTEGGNAAAAAARHVEAARAAEEDAVDGESVASRRTEGAAAAGAAVLCALGLLAMVREPRMAEAPAGGLGIDRAVRAPQGAAAAPPIPVAREARAISPVLATAASLCTDFGRARDVADVNQLLARAADVMDASGLVVWVGAAAAPDNDRLRPALAHGYSPAAIAKMPPVPRSADNAAAAAYRTGALQIVLTRPGVSAGAVVAPLLAAEGCVGALAVEVRSGGEGSDSVQALAAIFAAQLAPMVSASFASADEAPARAAASQ